MDRPQAADEAQWIQAARNGDRLAFGRLVEAYQRPVYGLAYRMLGSATEAEDAAQEAFLKAYRALGSYDPARSFTTWLLSITAHHCIDRIRRRRPEPQSIDDMPPWRGIPSDGPDPERSAIDADRAAWISGLLGRLGEADRLVLVLRYWQDLGYLEIAEMLETSEAAVKSRLHRARRQMAEMMAPQVGAGPRSPSATANLAEGHEQWTHQTLTTAN